jgi:hypothetical protein
MNYQLQQNNYIYSIIFKPEEKCNSLMTTDDGDSNPDYIAFNGAMITV